VNIAESHIAREREADFSELVWNPNPSALFCAAVAAGETEVLVRLERAKIERPLSRTSTSSRMRIR
jgi:hypothetical protein